jgi:hypothetical protein
MLFRTGKAVSGLSPRLKKTNILFYFTDEFKFTPETSVTHSLVERGGTHSVRTVIFGRRTLHLASSKRDEEARTGGVTSACPTVNSTTKDNSCGWMTKQKYWKTEWMKVRIQFIDNKRTVFYYLIDCYCKSGKTKLTFIAFWQTRGTRGGVPVSTESRIFTSLYRRDPLRGPSSLLSNGY